MAWLYGDFLTIDHTGDVTINGTLTVETLVAADVVSTGDNCILLNNDVTGLPTEDAGIEIERGSATNAQWKFNETTDHWQGGLVGSLEDVAYISDIPAAVTDHGALTGLGDDDHLQYLTEARHDALPADNPHAVTKTQVGLSNVPNVDATARANHTGTQLASTISDFASTVRSTILTGLSLATSSAVTAADSVLVAIGKLQAQINANVFGRQFQNGQSLGLFTTSNTTYTQAFRFTTTSLPAGNYYVAWSADVGNTNSDKGFAARIQENDTTTLSFLGARIKEADKPTTEQQIPFAGHAIRTLSGVVNFDIDIATKDNSATAQNMRITLWRVS